MTLYAGMRPAHRSKKPLFFCVTLCVAILIQGIIGLQVAANNADSRPAPSVGIGSLSGL